MLILDHLSKETTLGVLVVDKPIGVTSHDVVAWARRVTGVRKIGHSGTLDPLATGVLILLIGREYTKLQSNFLKQDKTYQVSFLLGAESETLDVLDSSYTEQLRALPRSWQSIKARSDLVKKAISHYENKIFTRNAADLTTDKITEVLYSFEGSYQQTVPQFSAVKVKGKKLYEAARESQLDSVTLPSRLVEIYSISSCSVKFLAKQKKCVVTCTVRCSSGTYVRALVRDVAEKLGTVGVVTELRRVASGEFLVKDACVCPLL